MVLQRDNKALNAKHAQILRELVRQPDNKICADCKRNDARWASVNLGVFMCIRCSGIHRSIGVHVTRIKSVDLDTWLPEQIAVVTRWGNRRANLYWEAHLKPGHVPPEHKMDSFIRSKYESKRWVLSPEVPDPETLEPAAAETKPSASTTAAAPRPGSSAKTASASGIDLLSPPTPAATLSTPGASSAPSTKTASGGGGGLFDLDFSASPALSATPKAPKTAKDDILSLFSSAPPVPQAQVQPQHRQNPSSDLNSAFAGLDFGAPPARSQAPPSYPSQPAQSLFQAPPAVPAPAPASQWPAPAAAAAPQASNFGSLFDSNPWGATANAPVPAATQPQAAQDPFAGFGAFSSGGSGAPGAFDDIWK